MVSDNSHATRQILGRVVDYYDTTRALVPEERAARELSARILARLARIDEIEAATMLADALARRAANKLTGAP